ncbi:MAG: glycoside hydrolase family 2 protein [Prolixibacteraceae bacterium]
MNKKALLIILLLISALCGLTQTYNINSNWSFIKDESNTLSPDKLNGLDMQTINIPHTWNTEDVYDDEPGYYRGVGWYKRNFYVADNQKDKVCYVYFEAANQEAEVYINGKLLGKHKGGYTAFCFDISSLIHYGKENTIVVKVDNKHNLMIPPLSADYTFFGGIYRDVYLVYKTPVHFDMTNLGCQGNYISTEKSGNDKFLVKIKSLIRNSSKTSQEVNLNYTINKKGIEVAGLEESVLLNPGEIKIVENNLQLVNPLLWSPDSPELYELEAVILQKGQQLDAEYNNIGIRDYKFTGDKGLVLNGQALKMHGVNRHQEFGTQGWAISNEIHESDAQTIKEMGFNYLRLAHYPQDKSMLNSCDKLGLIVWEEIPVVNEITMDEAFYSTCDTMLREMILQHYNHPSIFLWGYMNEIFIKEGEDKKGVAQDIRFEETVKLAKRLNGLAKELDPNRPTTMACEYKDYYNSTGLADIPDVIGWNLYFGWYYEQFSDLTRFLNEEHDKYPQRPLIISEYGAGADPRISSNHMEAFDFSLEFQNAMITSYLDQYKALDYLSGSSIWVFNDFNSENRGDAVPHINSKGLVGMHREKKEIYYTLVNEPTKYFVIPISRHQLLNNNDSDEELTDSLTLPQSIGNSIMYNMESHGDLNYALNFGANKSIYHPQSHTLFIASDKFSSIIDMIGGQNYKKKTWSGYITGTNENVLNTDFDPMYQTYLTNIEILKFEAPKGLFQIDFFYITSPEKSDEMQISINDDLIFEKIVMTVPDKVCIAQKEVVLYNNLKDSILINFDVLKGETRLSGLKIKKID